MPIKIKQSDAAILVKQNSPLIVDKIDLPEELNYGQVLVKVEISGICGSQIGEINGTKGPDKYLPHLLGHEGCGKIIEIGPGVKTVSVGDKVVLHWRQGNGIQAEPAKYKWEGKPLNSGWVTTFNSHAVISENRCTKVSKDLNPEHASLLGCAITTGFGVVENNACLKMGESVVVYGAGGIGLSIIQAAKSVSAWPIIAIDIFEKRLELAQKIGATHIINSLENDPKKEIRNILQKQELDVFIDNTGLPKVIENGYSIIKSDGRLILVGVPKRDKNINIHSLPLHFGKLISGSHGGESIPHRDIPRYIRHIKKNNIDLDSIITKKFDLKNINEAIKSMQDGETAGRVLIKF